MSSEQEMQTKIDAFREGARLVLNAFAAGVFCRNPRGDTEPGWALRLVGPIRGLAILQQAVDDTSPAAAAKHGETK